MDGLNRKTGERNSCYACNSQCHYDPQCPKNENHAEGPLAYRQVPKQPSSQPYPVIATESPLQVQRMKSGEKGDADRRCEQSFSTTLGVGGGCARRLRGGA